MSGGGGETRVRYAPNIETAHSKYIDGTPTTSITHAINRALTSASGGFYNSDNGTKIGLSPYGDYNFEDIREGYFGVVPGDDQNTTYDIKNFPSMWEIYGRFLPGVDVLKLWGDIYDDTIHGPELDNSIAAQAQLIQDNIDENILPRFYAGMRDINAVQSSAFIVGKALIARGNVTALNDAITKIRLAAVNLSGVIWARKLDWDRDVVTIYQGMFRDFYASDMDHEAERLDFRVKDAIWDVEVIDNARAMIGALNGAAAATEKRVSKGARIASGALGGAAAGSVLGPYGALIGGIAGAGAAAL